MLNVPEVLKACREHAGLSQLDASEISGVHRSNISMYERGLHIPSLYNFEALIETCGFELRVVRKETNGRLDR